MAKTRRTFEAEQFIRAMRLRGRVAGHDDNLEYEAHARTKAQNANARPA